MHGSVGDEGVQLVKLRNPNGHAGWRGPWSIGGRGWDAKSREQLRPSEEDEGVFWMLWEDFFRFFAELTVCRLLPDHLEVCALRGELGGAWGGRGEKERGRGSRSRSLSRSLRG